MAAFDLRSLEIFLAVCEAGGMGRAATALGVTQAAVSQQIARLESRCGAPLFERHRDGLRITSAGARLRYHAQRILSDVGEAEAAMRTLERPEIAHLTICIMETLGDLLAPALVSRCKSHAGHIEVATGTGLRHADGLLRNHYDLIVTSDLPDAPEGLEIHELMVEPCVAVVPAGFLGRGPVDLQALAYALPLVRYGTQRRLGKMIDRYLTRLALDIPQTLDFDRASLVLEMVARGQGLGDHHAVLAAARARAARRRRDAAAASADLLAPHRARRKERTHRRPSGRARGAVPGPHRDRGRREALAGRRRDRRGRRRLTLIEAPRSALQ